MRRIDDIDSAILGEKEELNENKRRRKKSKSKNFFKKFFILMFIIGIICCYIRTIFIIWSKKRI